MNNILFDLDGTLTDPFLGICKAVNYSLKYFNKDVENLEDLKKFIGPPLDVSYKVYYHMNDDDIEIAIKNIVNILVILVYSKMKFMKVLKICCKHYLIIIKIYIYVLLSLMNIQ